jgi:hypothetical protein
MRAAADSVATSAATADKAADADGDGDVRMSSADPVAADRSAAVAPTASAAAAAAAAAAFATATAAFAPVGTSTAGGPAVGYALARRRPRVRRLSAAIDLDAEEGAVMFALLQSENDALRTDNAALSEAVGALRADKAHLRAQLDAELIKKFAL